MNEMKELPCVNCGSLAATSHQEGLFMDSGWSLNILGLGHYGGFTDCLPDAHDDDMSDYLVHLCHDCCVKMLEALPGLAQRIFPTGGGGHPNVGDNLESNDGTSLMPCCTYAWTWKKHENRQVTYFANADGGWAPAPWEPSLDDIDFKWF
jgi:hypothetical protein